MTRQHIAKAFSALHGKDAVFGPADDGGYWLIGLANCRASIPAGALKNVRWSTEHALADSIASFEPLRIGQAQTLSDVDTVADLKAF